MTTSDELFAALRRLRDAARGGSARDLAREREDWRLVDAFVRRSRAAQGDEGEDVVQETLFSIARHVVDLDARDATAALAWATRIVRNKKIDLARLRTKEAAHVQTREDEPSAVDLIERDDAHPIDERALDVLVEVVEEAIAVRVEGLRIASAAERQLKRTQARAALHRVLGADGDALRARLGLDAGVTSDRLAKWVERGRPLVASALESLAWDHEDPARAVFLSLRELVLARRGDAGLARPARRKGAGGGEP